MKKYTLLLAAIFLGTCKVPYNFLLVNQKNVNISIHKSVACNDFFNEVSANWYMDRSEHCFYYNPKLVNKIKENEKCFIGLTSDQLVLLFGKPQKSEKNVIAYYMDKTCEQRNLPPLHYVKFYKDWKSGTDTITSVQIGKVTLME